MIRVAETENGKVVGLPAADPRITSFKGIPFATPPIGDNRWRAPMPCTNWEGIREAYTYAPISIQDTPGEGDNIYVHEWHVDSSIPMDEDCLYLNIWTNAGTPADRKPVFVFLFGGVFQWGYPSEMELDGERLARRGIVVVTINYRLNVFGFLAHPELTKEQPDAPANFGNLDQQAGLRWVKRNIQNFGGDPDNITLGGQSAGGGSVLSQMTCMNNQGLFQRAIIQSGMIKSPYHNEPFKLMDTIDTAEKNGIRFFDFLGVKTLAQARELDAITIRDRYREYALLNPRMFPVIDGRFCTGNSYRMFATGEHLPIPVMAGNTKDEFIYTIHAASEAELTERTAEIYGEEAEAFLHFPESHKQTTDQEYAGVNGIECMIRGTFLEQKSPCYYYQFEAEIPGDDHPGDFHSVDLWFFFETLAKCARPFRGQHYDLARQMCDYWAAFIQSGDPNKGTTEGELPVWTPYTKENLCKMAFQTEGARLLECDDSTWKQFLIRKLMEEVRQS